MTINTCPACLAPVTIASDHEGTNSYQPLGPSPTLGAGVRCEVCGAEGERVFQNAAEVAVYLVEWLDTP